uniref:PorV/PorQ family protein n=1 Tax=candidate division WOR-3 bacterium TaxID=2052148 RepID=A0A7C4YGV0_UNCW3
MVIIIFSLFYEDIKNIIEWFNRIGSPVGFEMLYIDKDPEISSTGGVYFFKPEFSMNINPSYPLVQDDNCILSFSHRTHYADSYLDQINYLKKSGKYYFGLVFEGLFSGEMELHDSIPGTSDITYNGYDLALYLSSGYRFKKILLGVTLKYLREKIFIEDISTYGFDIGLTEEIGEGRFGLSLLNLGPKYYGKMRFRLPLTWRIGYGIEKGFNDYRIGIGIDIVKPLHNVTEFHTGLNFKYSFIDLSIGKKFRNNLEGLSTGLTLSIRRLRFSYGFIILKNSDISSNIKTSWRF